jgi:calcineurin-like phosphoesterase family protein
VTHFGHGNIIKYSKRLECCNEHEKYVILKGTPQEFAALRLTNESISRMNELLIERWNAKVPPDGTVYHLGDFAFRGDVEEARRICSRLNGKIYLVLGNHDQIANQLRSRFEWTKDYFELKVKDDEAKGGLQKIVLMHYAMKVWNGSHRDSWHLFGHSHGSLLDDPCSRSFDVGVDCHGLAPLSYREVKRIISKKDIVPLDHR